MVVDKPVSLPTYLAPLRPALVSLAELLARAVVIEHQQQREQIESPKLPHRPVTKRVAV